MKWFKIAVLLHTDLAFKSTACKMFSSPFSHTVGMGVKAEGGRGGWGRQDGRRPVMTGIALCFLTPPRGRVITGKIRRVGWYLRHGTVKYKVNKIRRTCINKESCRKWVDL